MILRVWLLSVTMICASFAQEKQQTAFQIVGQIRKNLVAPARQSTVDAFKAGDSSTVVKGIAVTMMATLDVLQRAVERGDNFIITHETPFYSHFEPKVPMSSYKDPVYEAKQAFVREHGLVLWQFHDFPHAQRPDMILTGMVRALGWKNYQDKDDGRIFHVPSTTLNELALSIKENLGVRAMRVIGNPESIISCVGLSPGFAGFERNRELFQQAGIDVLVIGEAHEWELGEYADDAVAEKNKKGLIVLGHIPSEQAGMEDCVHWLETFIKDVKIEFVPASEPFWVPE